MLRETKVIRISAQFLVAGLGDQKIVFQPKATAPGPVNARFDREHHSFFYGSGAGLVGIRPLVRARADTVANGMRRLSRIATFGDAGANQFVELGKAGAVACERNCLSENFQ